MPLFEFHCSSCDRDFEELVRNDDDSDAVRCPHCRSAGITRKLSVFSARAAARESSSAFTPGPCGRCGDPNGPCGL